MKKIIVDLDGTITYDNSKLGYSDKDLNKQCLGAIEAAISMGYSAEIFTARNMRTYKGDLKLIKENTLPVIHKWLEKNNVPISTVNIGKPWCGEGGYYIDDKCLHPEEFIYRFLGPFAPFSFDIVMPLFNEEKNIFNIRQQVIELSRIVDLNQVILVNNGSVDSTASMLKSLKNELDIVNIIHLDSNQGYGGGIKAGLKYAQSDFVILSHADGQFHIPSFLRDFSNHYNINKTTLYTGTRVGRSIVENLSTFFAQKIISIFARRAFGDFNSQPKIFSPRHIKLENLDEGFNFDLSLYMQFSNFEHRKILVKDRVSGHSSWSGKRFSNGLKILISMIQTAIRRS